MAIDEVRRGDVSEQEIEDVPALLVRQPLDIHRIAGVDEQRLAASARLLDYHWVRAGGEGLRERLLHLLALLVQLERCAIARRFGVNRAEAREPALHFA